MTQNEAVILTLEKLGGVATLGELNANVFELKECKWQTKTPFASIRRIVRHTAGIYRIKPGLYGLEKMREAIEKRGIQVESADNTGTEANVRFSHAYYQSLLLTIGNLRHLHTFLPAQDKNRMLHTGQKLGELASLKILPDFSYPKLVRRSSTVDAIWLNSRGMPHSFFEVEHTTDIQNSLLKFNDLRDFHARMVIVADASRKGEFLQKTHNEAFGELIAEKRVSFLSYEALVKQYEQEIERQQFDFIL